MFNCFSKKSTEDVIEQPLSELLVEEEENDELLIEEDNTNEEEKPPPVKFAFFKNLSFKRNPKRSIQIYVPGVDEPPERLPNRIPSALPPPGGKFSYNFNKFTSRLSSVFYPKKNNDNRRVSAPSGLMNSHDDIEISTMQEISVNHTNIPVSPLSKPINSFMSEGEQHKSEDTRISSSVPEGELDEADMVLSMSPKGKLTPNLKDDVSSEVLRVLDLEKSDKKKKGSVELSDINNTV